LRAPAQLAGEGPEWAVRVRVVRSGSVTASRAVVRSGADTVRCGGWKREEHHSAVRSSYSHVRWWAPASMAVEPWVEMAAAAVV
jgi:hypothetical protein